MKKKLYPLYVILSTMTCASISLSAHADEYQFESHLGLIDIDGAYARSLDTGLKYYFEPVDDSLGPKSLAPLLSKSSGVELNYTYTSTFVSDANIDNVTSPNFNIKWVFDNSMYVAYHQMFEWINYRSNSSITTDLHGNKFSAGYFFDNDSYLEISDYAVGDDKQNYYNEVAISGGRLFRLDNDKYVNVSGEFSQSQNENHHYDSKSIKLSGAYFPNNDLEFNGNLELHNYRVADSENALKLGTRYFFSNTLSASLAMERIKYGDNLGINRQYVSLSKRF